MAILATRVPPHHWAATFGGLAAVAIAAASRGRATFDFVSASISPSALPLLFSFTFHAVPAFFAASAATAAVVVATAAVVATVGEHITASMTSMASMASMASVRLTRPVFIYSLVQISNGLADDIAAYTGKRCHVPCLNIKLSRRSTIDDGVQFVVV